MLRRMKYAIIIPDGAADDPLDVLSGRTPLEASRKPFMDEVARAGLMGTARTVPDGFESGSDVATMSLLGYDPAVFHTGRAPLEAAAQRIPLGPRDWVFRCNLVTTHDGRMIDHSVGGIPDAQARVLLKDLSDDLELKGYEFVPGVSYRNLLVVRTGEAFDVKVTPPHEIPNEPIASNLPKGTGEAILNRIMSRSAELFADHPINRARRSRGEREATQVWLWGYGHPPAMPRFVDRFGVSRAAMITGVDLLRGLAVLMGWDVLDVPGITSFHDTDYAGQGRATAAALDRYDMVLSHVESPDEASHQADWKTKIAAIEAIDEHVVGPVLAKLRTYPQWRLLVLPDHPTNIATRKHGYAPTCWAMAGSDIHPGGATAYSEAQASRGRVLANGHDLMSVFVGR
jgi:2,3-bisphosphoglycerate-independent phosphoglycerate mutase